MSCIPDSKAQDSGFNEQNFPGFGILQVKIFSDSGIRIPLHGRIQGRGRGPAPPPPSPFLLFLDQTEARRAQKKFFLRLPPLSQGLDDRPPYLKVCIRQCHPGSTHIFQFPLSVKNRRFIRVLWMFKLFLAKKPQVNLQGNLKRQTGNGILV